MSFHFTVTEKQLRLALNELEIAKKNGWDACNVLFNMTEYGQNVSEIKAEYEDLLLGTTKSEDKFGRSCGSHRYGKYDAKTNNTSYYDVKTVPVDLYMLLSQKLHGAIGDNTYFNGVIEVEYNDNVYVLHLTIIITEKEIIPVWWEFSSFPTNQLTDFSWVEFSKYLKK